MPVTDSRGNKQIVMIKADVDEGALQKIATETGGKFYRATDTDSLKKIYAEIDRLEKTTHTLKKFESQHELFPWALLPALGLLGHGHRPGADPVPPAARERTRKHNLW